MVIAMKANARFRLRITAYTPETIPMARLAEYMRELAVLMGSESSAHYRGATKGSTVMNVEVAAEDTGKVAARLLEATSVDAPAEARKAIASLEALMRADNATGTLTLPDGRRAIRFLGIEAMVPERVGPIREFTTVQGEVVRVGGKDRSLHALLIGDDGQSLRLSTGSRETAKLLAAQLFSRVRASGVGTWYRNDSGAWELEELKLQSFEPLEERTLLEAVSELRNIEGAGWRDLDDPLAALREMRKH
jgi:hypothetical protein